MNANHERTLSVSIVATSSSAATVSPGCFNHVFNVPSDIDSAIWGTLTVSAITRHTHTPLVSISFSFPNDDPVQNTWTSREDEN